MKIVRIAEVLFLIIFMTGALAITNAQNSTKAPIELFKEKKCNSCHSIQTLGIEKKNKKSKGGDLSNVGSKYEVPFLVDYLKKKVEIDGKKHGIKFKGSDEELMELVGFLSTLRTEPENDQ